MPGRSLAQSTSQIESFKGVGELMKTHLLGMMLFAGLGVATISPAEAVETKDAKAAFTNTISAVELGADNTYQDLPKLDASQGLARHRYMLWLPKGASLHPVADEQGHRRLQAEIVVKDESGLVLGTVDSAWAQDADGNSLPTYFTIDGDTLIQTVDTSKAAEKTATAVFTYSGINYQEPVPTIGRNASSYVGVPSNYKYGTQYSPRSLHDYCTKSPDEFPNAFGTNASFRGPCARHDLCYQYHSSSKAGCDNALYSNMVSNCNYYYSTFNPVRATCIATARVYWAAVTAFGGY